MDKSIKRTNSHVYEDNRKNQEMRSDVAIGVLGLINLTLKDVIRQTTLKDSQKVNPKKSRHPLNIMKQSINKLIKRQPQVRCNICQQTYGASATTQFTQCLHTFCTTCLDQYIAYKINKGQEVNCPQDTCKSKLTDKSELFLQLPIELKNKFKKTQKFLLTVRNPNLKQCHQPNCQGVYDTSKIPCSCQTCNSKYCHKCSYKEHVGECQEFQIEFLQQQFKFRQCNMCKNLIEKNQGCNHITCKCGYNFCYLCGAQWQSDPCRYGGNPPPAPVYVPPREPRGNCVQCMLKSIKIFLLIIYAAIAGPLFIAVVALILVGTMALSVVIGGISLMIDCELDWWIIIILFPFILVGGIFWYFFDNLDVACDFIGSVAHGFLWPVEQIWDAC